uniref:Uncharacterized protein n=1 Tax=Arundo donax TaxID=35708 RepID=A0A0A9AN92_ARUDO
MGIFCLFLNIDRVFIFPS